LVEREGLEPSTPAL